MPGPGNGTPSDSFLLMAMVWALLAMALFWMRPKALRSDPSEKREGGRDGGAGRGPRDPDPPAVM